MTKLIFSSFPKDTTEDDLRELLKEYWVKSVILRGECALVIFGTEWPAEGVLEGLNGKVWRGRRLKVKPW